MESRRSEKKNAKKIIRKAMIAKKLTALGMAVVLVFSLAACGAAVALMTSGILWLLP